MPRSYEHKTLEERGFASLTREETQELLDTLGVPEGKEQNRPGEEQILLAPAPQNGGYTLTREETQKLLKKLEGLEVTDGRENTFQGGEQILQALQPRNGVYPTLYFRDRGHSRCALRLDRDTGQLSVLRQDYMSEALEAAEDREIFFQEQEEQREKLEQRTVREAPVFPLEIPFRTRWDLENVTVTDLDGREYRSFDDMERALREKVTLPTRFSDEPEQQNNILLVKDNASGVTHGIRLDEDGALEISSDPVTEEEPAEKQHYFAVRVNGEIYQLLSRWKVGDIARLKGEDDEEPYQRENWMDYVTGSGSYFLYPKEGGSPYALINIGGRMFCSDEPVPEGGTFVNTERDAADPPAYRLRDGTLVPLAEIGKNLFEQQLHQGFDSLGFDFAVDASGRIYETWEKFSEQLRQHPGTENRLFVFSPGQDLPRSVVNEDGLLLFSQDAVSTQSILPDTQPFEPKPSLYPRDIHRAATPYEAKMLKERSDDAGKFVKYGDRILEDARKQEKGCTVEKAREELRRIRRSKLEREGKTVYEEYLYPEKEPKPPEEPKLPRLSFFQGIGWGLVKVFTLGRGDTAANRRVKEERKTVYPKKLEAYQAKRAAYEEVKARRAQEEEEVRKHHEERTAFYAERTKSIKDHVERCKKEYPKLKEAASKQGYTHADDVMLSVREVASYRGRTEAFLEGVADLRKNGGRVTEANIFANSKLLEKRCEGKSMTDPEAQEQFMDYYASSMVERKLLEDYSENPEYAQTSANLVQNLNSGAVKRSLQEDPLFRQALGELLAKKRRAYLEAHPEDAALISIPEGGEPKPAPGVDRRQFDDAWVRMDRAVCFSPASDYSELQERMKALQMEAVSPVGRLKALRKNLIAEFGEKPLSEECMADIMRLKTIDKQIENEKRREANGLDTSEEYIKKTFRYIITDIQLDPTKGQTRVLTDMEQYLKGDWLEAMRRLEKAEHQERSEKPADYVHGAKWKELEKVAQTVEQNGQDAGELRKMIQQMKKGQQEQEPLQLEKKYDLETMAEMVTKEREKILQQRELEQG